MTSRRNEGIAVAIAADPGAETQDQGQIERFDVEIVCGLERFRDFAVEHRQRGEDGDVVIVEAHLHFVVNGGTAGADFVGLPQAGDFSQQQIFDARQFLLGERDAVELGEKFADAAALEHDGAARSLSGVRGEDGYNQHAAQIIERFLCADADAAHFQERACKRAALAAGLAAKLQRDAAALAVIGLREVDELKVEGKGAGEQAWPDQRGGECTSSRAAAA